MSYPAAKRRSGNSRETSIERLFFCEDEQLAGNYLIFAVVEKVCGLDGVELNLLVAELTEFIDKWQMGDTSICGTPSRNGHTEWCAAGELGMDVFEELTDDVVTVAAYFCEFD